MVTEYKLEMCYDQLHMWNLMNIYTYIGLYMWIWARVFPVYARTELQNTLQVLNLSDFFSHVFLKAVAKFPTG